MLLRGMVLLTASVCANLIPAATPAAGSDARLLPASDARFRYDGRVDRRDSTQPVLIWSGVRVSIDFSGEELTILFGAASDQSVFNVTVDGHTELVDVRAEKGNGRFRWPRALSSGRHRLEIFKRSEAAKGHAGFLGIELAAGAEAWQSADPGYRVKFEFFGDSITAGACNEDGAVDQWEDFRTHNHALSYDYLTSQAFRADHRALAISGMGAGAGWVEVKVGQVWDRLYPRADSPATDLAVWQPDVVFINYGENDESYTSQNALPFPEGYVPGYVGLVKNLRRVYPEAHIVLLRGGMGCGANSLRLREAWEKVVQLAEAGDSRVTHYVFKHWSALHPRVSDHRLMADELTAWLQQQPFMKTFQQLTPGRRN